MGKSVTVPPGLTFRYLTRERKKGPVWESAPPLDPVLDGVQIFLIRKDIKRCLLLVSFQSLLTDLLNCIVYSCMGRFVEHPFVYAATKYPPRISHVMYFLVTVASPQVTSECNPLLGMTACIFRDVFFSVTSPRPTRRSEYRTALIRIFQFKWYSKIFRVLVILTAYSLYIH